MVALRYNVGKTKLSKVFEFGPGLHMLIKVMEQGATKYLDGNWLKGGKPDGEYLDSAMRHIEAFMSGEFYDPDIGAAHLASAAWNLLAVLCVNYGQMDLLDPDFDQVGFVEKYADLNGDL